MAFALALIVWVVTGVSVWLIVAAKASMPVPIWEAGRSIDSQFFLTLTITGIAFVLVQGMLGWFILKYRDRPNSKARYVEGNNAIEIGGMLVVAIIFVTLAFMGQKVWAKLHLGEQSADRVVIELTGEQFAWNVRYPGPDGQFGETRPDLYDAISNPMGIVPEDAAGNDDIVVLNTVAVPVNTQIELQLGSKDVLHNFFAPVLRIKQDTVPGMRIPLRFVAEQTGDYEVACSELCGLGHYRMRAFLQVKEPADFQAWLVEQASE